MQLSEADRYIGRIVDVVGRDNFRIQATLIRVTNNGIVLDRGVGNAIVDHEIPYGEIRTLEVHPE